MLPTHADCWAKTDPDTDLPALTVRDHCLIVGAVAEAILRRLTPAASHLPPLGAATLAGIHDIGKISPGFQLKCPFAVFNDTAARNFEGDHAKIGQAWLGTLMELRGDDRRSPAWVLSIGAHHGVYHPDVAPVSPHLRKEAQLFPWGDALRRELLAFLSETFGPLSNGALVRDSARLHWLTGFITFADWIGSNSEWFKLIESGPLQDIWTPECARDAAGGAVESLGWHRTGVRLGLGFGDLYEPTECGAPLSPRPLQSALLEAVDGPGLYIVEAPMGMGKTEAALAAAYQRWSEGGERGLYFALPTQLTSNRIHDRISDFLDRVVADCDSVQALVHGNAWLFPDRIRALQPTHSRSDGDATDAHTWFASGRRALLAPFGTGTIDQALMAVMAAKHSALRLFALAGKAVVIDEVHSYDPYTSALVDRLVKHLLEVGCSIFILSATLTARRRRELVEAAGSAIPEDMPDDYPLITAVKRGEPLAAAIRVEDERPQTVTVTIEHGAAEDAETWQVIANAAEAGACVLVIRNTVKSAQETYRRLKEALRGGTGVEIGLIHSRFTFLDRQENEKFWMKKLGRDGAHRPQSGAILVATQVVEQSVDIDADLLVTDLAPVDLVLQRLGRLHRHRRDWRPPGFETPVCRLLVAEVDWEGDEKAIKTALGPSAWVYPPFSLYQAERIFQGRTSISLPGDIRGLLEDSDVVSRHLPKGANRFAEALHLRDRNMSLSAARQGWLDATTLPDTEGTKTRWGDDRSGLVVLLDAVSTTTVVLADGTSHSFRTGEFSYSLAKALHENAIRVPWYLIRAIVRGQLKWLGHHIEDAVLAVRVRDTKTLETLGSEVSSFNFSYSREEGLSHERTESASIPIEPGEDFWY